MFTSLMLLICGNKTPFENMNFGHASQDGFLTREEIIDMGSDDNDRSD